MDSGGIARASSDGLQLAGPGGRSILLKAGSTETQGAYSLLKFTAPPGSPWSTHHVHAATEAWYVLDGELTFRLGETILPAPAGSFVLAPGGTPHSQVNSAPTRRVVGDLLTRRVRGFLSTAQPAHRERPAQPASPRCA